jgi:fibronectin-binding autotransporter adhesin
LANSRLSRKYKNNTQTTIQLMKMNVESTIGRLTTRAKVGMALALTTLMATSGLAATEQWIGVAGVSATTNWSDAANWGNFSGFGSSTPPQTYYNQVQFAGTGASLNSVFSVNNVIDNISTVAQMPIWELDFVPTNGNYTTLIDPGITLTLAAGNGQMFVGADALNTASPAPANAIETITLLGAGGAFSMNGTLHVNQGSITGGDVHNVTLDLSGLDNFTDTGPEILVASGGAHNSHGTLYLAKTNNIYLGNDFQLCNQGGYSNSVPCAVYLGQNSSIATGTGNLIIGGSGTTLVGAFMKFNPAFIGGANPIPSAYFYGNNGSGRVANFWICNANGAPNVPGYALCDFSGGNIYMVVDAMQLGQAGTASALGVLTADDGFFNVNSAVIGNQVVGNGGAGTGIVNLNTNTTLSTSATLQVNNTLTLAEVSGGLTAGSAGTINVNGGTLTANNIVNGGGVGSINVTNGTLSVNGLGGTPSAPISSVILLNSALNLRVIAGSNSLVTTSLKTGGAGNTVNISSAPPFSSYPVKIALVKYSGSIGGAGYNFSLGTLPTLYAGYLSNDTANAAIDLVLTAGSGTLTWKGNINGNWDTTTANWLSGGSAVYADGEFVQFLDGAVTGTVNLTTALAPGSVTVSNSALNYTFNGAGSLGGSSGLQKSGSGTLVIDNSGANTFSGGVTISGGTLQIGNNDTAGSLPASSILDNGNLVFANSGTITEGNNISGSGSFEQAGAGGTLVLSGANSFTGNVVVTNGSTLQMGSSSALGSASGNLVVANGSTFDMDGNSINKPVEVSGSGVGGSGAITDSGGAVYSPALTVTLTGDTTFDYPNRWDFASGSTLSTSGNSYNLTLVASGYFQWQNTTLDPALGNINLTSGQLGVVGSTTFGDPNHTLTISSSGTLVFYGGPYSQINKIVDFQDGNIDNNSGNNIMTGQMTLEPGFCSFNINGGTSLTISNVLSGSGVVYLNGGTGTLTLSGNSPSFSGGVSLYKGGVVLDGTIGSGITSLSGTVISGKGVATGLVDVSGSLQPGDQNVAGTFGANGGLTLESGATLTSGLSPTISGNNDLVAVAGNLTANGNTIFVNPTGGTLQNGVYPLITYTGSLSGSFGGVQTVSSSVYTLTLTNITTTSPQQIAVIVSGSPSLLVWNNGGNNGEWDFSSLNWSNLVTHAVQLFDNPDTVVFNDTILNAATPATNIDIGSGQIVSPAVITNNSTVNYTLSGAGTISGATSVYKTGTGTMTINTVNGFNGNTTIAGGAVQVNNVSGLGSTTGTISVSNGATFYLNESGGYPGGDSGFTTKPIVLSGAGVNGKGALQIIGNPVYNDSSTFGLGRNFTLVGDTTIGGTARWDWGFPGLPTTLSTHGSNYNFTAIQPGYSQWNDVLIDPNLGNFDFYSTASSQQTWQVAALGGSLGNPTNVLTLHSNILMNIQHGDTAIGDNGYAKVIHVLPTAGFQFQPSGGAGDYRLNSAFVMENNSSLAFYSGTGGSGSGTVLQKPVVLNGLVHLQIGDSTVTFSNVISGPGGFYWDNYNNTVVFAAANTYQGITDLRSGRTLALAGTGSISGSTNIALTGATVDVTKRTDQTLTLALGQTLQGNGTINGSLTVGAGAIVSPGGTGAIGTITVSSNVVLSGTALMEVNQTAATSDLISSSGNIAYGGTLNVANLAGTLAAGDNFVLFSGATYSGAFAAINPATPGPGLAWNTGNLDSNGTLSIVAAAVPPTIKNITVSGGNVVISGTDNTGSGGTYHVLSSTNITLPIGSWTVLTNGTFSASGTFTFTNSVGGNQNRFYILKIP